MLCNVSQVLLAYLLLVLVLFVDKSANKQMLVRSHIEETLRNHFGGKTRPSGKAWRIAAATASFA